MSTERETRSTRCTGRLHKEFACKRESEHSGVHLAEIIYNGTLCEMGWRDSDSGAWRALPPVLRESAEK